MRGQQLQRRQQGGGVEIGGPGSGSSPAYREEVDLQISTARAYPRNIEQAVDEAMMMATADEETAGDMFYSLERSGKPIEGPSARLAEVVATAWGNLRWGFRILGHDGKQVTAEGFCFDLEKNNAYRAEVKRRITKRNGETFSDDMIVATGNAAGSIAARNAIFKIVPAVFVKKILREAKRVSVGDANKLAENRQKAVAWFQNIGVSEEQVLKKIGRASIDDVTLDDLATLRGLSTALREGDTSKEEAFDGTSASGDDEPSEKAKGAEERLKNLSKKQKEKQEPKSVDDAADEADDLSRARAAFKDAVEDAKLDSDNVIEAWRDHYAPDGWDVDAYRLGIRHAQESKGVAFLRPIIWKLLGNDAVSAELQEEINDRLDDVDSYSRRKANNDVKRLLEAVRGEG